MNVALFVSINDGIIEMKSANIKSRKPALSHNKNLSSNLKMPMYKQTKKLIMLQSLYKNIPSKCSLFPQFLLQVFTKVKLPLNYYQFFSFCKHFIRNCVHLFEQSVHGQFFFFVLMPTGFNKKQTFNLILHFLFHLLLKQRQSAK